MAGEEVKLTVTAKRRILKYAEGADPAVDEPIGVDEKEIVLVGAEAEQALKEMGISKETALEIAKGVKENGIN